MSYDEENLTKEIIKVMTPFKSGVKEGNIVRVLNALPFIQAKKEAYSNSNTGKVQKGLFSEIRRISIWKPILKLINDGHTTSEIAKSLTLPYSTVYYYRKKFQKREKPRETTRDSFKYDKELNEIIRIKEPAAQRKARIAVKKAALSAAEEKRKRRAEKRLSFASIARKGIGT
jgi:hypothetical protein